MTNFKGPAQRRTAAGLARAAAVIGCEVAVLQADIQVEAASSGFDSQGRPKALFEPHLFYRYLAGPARDLAASQGLAYLKWGTHPYPADSYPRIEAAMRIDPDAALRATSWGVPQILGANHLDAGYQTAAAMVDAFVADGEDEHLAAMARFIVANPAMQRALVARDWSVFARLYNGAATKGYDAKLAAAYTGAISLHPADINASIAAKDSKAASRAKTSGSVVAGAIVVGAPVAAALTHGHLGLIAALAGAGVLGAAIFAVRALAFGNKAAAFSAPLMPPPAAAVPPVVIIAPATPSAIGAPAGAASISLTNDLKA
jgi:hypothetical protein